MTTSRDDDCNHDVDPLPLATRLVEEGYVVLPGRFTEPAAAWDAAAPIARVSAGNDRIVRSRLDLEVLSTYTMPAPGALQRDFQLLHIDFGVPLGISTTADVARYTVLHVDAAARGSGTVTRLIPFGALAKQRSWPNPAPMAAALQSRREDPDSAEGVLARILESIDGSSVLPDKRRPGFLCGLEFDNVEAEYAFTEAHGLDVASVERRVCLQPGQTMIFDNLAGAHGRLGRRDELELHQQCLGHAALSHAEQAEVLRIVLSRLTAADV